MSCDHELANEWARCSGKNASYITIVNIKHIMYGPEGNSFVFPIVRLFPETLSRETSGFSVKHYFFPRDNIFCYIAGVFPATACVFIG